MRMHVTLRGHVYVVTDEQELLDLVAWLNLLLTGATGRCDDDAAGS